MVGKGKGSGAPTRAPSSAEEREAQERRRAFNRRLDEEHAEIARQQKADFLQIAEMLVRNEPLHELDRFVAAAALRLVADQIPLKRKRARGKQPEFDHWEAACLFHAFTGKGAWTQQRAREYLADRYNVTEEAIRQAVEKHLDFHRAVSPSK